MKILVAGTGAVGGYFGGRLAEIGRDVTFLVREKRKEQLHSQGLQISSPHGDAVLSVSTISDNSSRDSFDIVIISTKAYQLEKAIQDVKHFTDSETMIIPLLNGIQHLDTLKEAFSEEQVAGGLCFIESTMNSGGKIMQSSPVHRMVFGPLQANWSNKLNEFYQLSKEAKAEIILSEEIEEEMWHKYMFIAGMSGVTTLFRSPVGLIRTYASTAVLQVFQEIADIMAAAGAPLKNNAVEMQMNTLNQMSDKMKSSMQRDMEKGAQTEASHLQGYLLKLAAKHGVRAPLLTTIHQNLTIYSQQYPYEK
ncbi:2-dehydropantoate 2-reductase [Bacillus lacus]|uniref:2-dehydropantoate 2-reductase n=1 Tax=Metabacillus lacus TaxID=1983721 RepID=A0A7X2IXU2_9BACI|nr:ketopantoate reductase family protein [Metabacillus lacus]MRX71635.1 2-dehydropantoate 2-reductase [Metabacillus lacus]